MNKQKVSVSNKDSKTKPKPIFRNKSKKKTDSLDNLKKNNLCDVIHELKVHQIELEMQNDELRRLQLLLENSREKYIDLYDFAPVAYFSLSAESQIKELNLSGADLLKSARNKLIDSRFRKHVFFEDLDKWDSYFFSVLKSEDKNNIELRLIRTDGTVIHVLIEAVRIKSAGDITGIRMAISDISELKIAEENLIKTESELRKLNAEKDKLFSIIAHDLRSPFSGFLFFTDLISKEIFEMPKSEIQDITKRLNNSAVNLYRMINNLLEWAMLQQGMNSFHPSSVNLFDTADSSVSEIQDLLTMKNLKLENNIERNFIIFADSQILKTVFRNLLSNATKFTNKNGTIIISADFLEGNIAEVCISDTGIGMDKNILNNIFKLNFKGKRKGTDGEPSTGLGLLLCSELVKRNGGNMRVESEVNKGSKFYFTVPVENKISNN